MFTKTYVVPVIAFFLALTASCDVAPVESGVVYEEATATETCVGDLDGDNDTDFADFMAFRRNFGKKVRYIGDLDGDGEAQFSDFLILNDDFGCTYDCEGDVDGDGDTDHGDLVILLRYFAKDLAKAQGDLDRDGEIQFSDFLILSNDFGCTCLAGLNGSACTKVSFPDTKAAMEATMAAAMR